MKRFASLARRFELLKQVRVDLDIRPEERSLAGSSGGGAE